MKNEANKIENCFKIVGKNIAYYRKKKKITLEELGFGIGLDKSAIFHIEKGKPITLRTLLKIAAYLEIPINDLLINLPNLSKNDLDF